SDGPSCPRAGSRRPLGDPTDRWRGGLPGESPFSWRVQAPCRSLAQSHRQPSLVRCHFSGAIPVSVQQRRLGFGFWIERKLRGHRLLCLGGTGFGRLWFELGGLARLAHDDLVVVFLAKRLLGT